MNKNRQKGFTLIELLVAMALAMVVMGAIFKTFKSQQDSFIIQDQVAAMQQNLRGAMYILTQDLQLAGYYTNFDRNTRTLDWDNHDNDNNITTGTEAIRPLIYAGDNVSASGDDIKDGTDTITIVKASNEIRDLKPGESATSGGPGSATISLSSWVDGGGVTRNALDLDGDGNVDLNASTKKFALLVKSDLRTAEFFEVQMSGSNIVPAAGLANSYTTGDFICRVDVILYKVDDQDPTRPSLVRKNLGNSSGATTIAENIDNLQFRYQLNNGSWTDDPAGSEALVRAVQVFMLARSAHTHRGFTDTQTYTMGNGSATPNDGFRRKLLCSTIKTRNIGLTE
jgi:prepilin-type N-terminal cleavage/methylation domain-containing protein